LTVYRLPVAEMAFNLAMVNLNCSVAIFDTSYIKWSEGRLSVAADAGFGIKSAEILDIAELQLKSGSTQGLHYRIIIPYLP
jgi:hypothetical protein